MTIQDDITHRSADIHWPDGLTPTDADLFAHNEIVIQAPPHQVWQRSPRTPNDVASAPAIAPGRAREPPDAQLSAPAADRRLRRAGVCAAGSIAAGALTVVAIALGAIPAAAALLLAPAVLAVRACHWVRLAGRSRIGARSEDVISGLRPGRRVRPPPR